MRNVEHSKLIYFLAALDGSGRKQFREYLASPVFNKQEEPRKLYAYIEKSCLRKGVVEIDDGKALKAIWEGEKVAEGKLQKVKTILLNLFLEYLEFRNWHDKAGRRKVGLLEELNALEDQSYFDQYYRKALQSLEKSKEKNLELFRHQLDMEAQRTIFLQKYSSRSEENHFGATSKALENHLVAYVLKFAFVAANQSRIVGEDSFPEWISACAEGVTFEQVKGYPLLEIYYLLYQTRSPETDASLLDQLRALIAAHASEFSHTETYDLFTGAINNASRQNTLTETARLQQLFELYQSMVEIYARGKEKGLSPWHFKNIVYLGGRLGAFAWVEEMLLQGETLLVAEPDAKALSLIYNRGVLQFFREDYAAAAKSFYNILPDAKDIFYAADARAYLLMCYYETGDSMGMESLVHSFRMFLTRSEKVSEVRKESYLDFIRLFRRVLSTPLKDDFRLQQLKTEIEGLKFSAGKSWLLQKVVGLGS